MAHVFHQVNFAIVVGKGGWLKHFGILVCSISLENADWAALRRAWLMDLSENGVRTTLYSFIGSISWSLWITSMGRSNCATANIVGIARWLLMVPPTVSAPNLYFQLPDLLS